MANYEALVAATNDVTAKSQALSTALGQPADQATLTGLVKELRKAHRKFRNESQAAGFGPADVPGE
jgi:hypothetical protein